MLQFMCVLCGDLNISRSGGSFILIGTTAEAEERTPEVSFEFGDWVSVPGTGSQSLELDPRPIRQNKARISDEDGE
jgi:hypothetical protein